MEHLLTHEQLSKIKENIINYEKNIVDFENKKKELLFAIDKNENIEKMLSGEPIFLAEKNHFDEITIIRSNRVKMFVEYITPGPMINASQDHIINTAGDPYYIIDEYLYKEEDRNNKDYVIMEDYHVKTHFENYLPDPKCFDKMGDDIKIIHGDCCDQPEWVRMTNYVWIYWIPSKLLDTYTEDERFLDLFF